MAISMKQITGAVQALEAAGEAVTTKRVREWIGSGSYTTISKLLRDYQEEQESLIPAPDHIRRDLTQCADRFWTRAIEEAALRYEGERLALLARGEKAEQELAERDEEILRLEALHEKVQAEGKRQEQKFEAVQRDASAAYQELQLTREQLTSEKARADTLERLWTNHRDQPETGRDELEPAERSP